MAASANNPAISGSGSTTSVNNGAASGSNGTNGNGGNAPAVPPGQATNGVVPTPMVMAPNGSVAAHAVAAQQLAAAVANRGPHMVAAGGTPTGKNTYFRF